MKTMRSLLEFCETFEEVFRKYLKTCCPCFYFILCTEHDRHKKLKAFAGFFYGVILGIGFSYRFLLTFYSFIQVLYYTILIDLEFGRKTTLGIAFLISLFLAVGNASSIQVRCTTVLVLPSFCGKSGRGVLKTIVLAYVLSGPFMTISNNAKEAVRVFACSTTLAYNLTKTRYELMVKPFQDALYQMREDTYEVTETLQTIQNVVQPIVEEVEGKKIDFSRATNVIDTLLQVDENINNKTWNEYERKIRRSVSKNGKKRHGEYDEFVASAAVAAAAKNYERTYKRKLEKRCQDAILKGTERCQGMFADAWSKCMEGVNLFVAWLLCWPLKLDYICNLAEVFGGDSICDPSAIVRPGFGEGYQTLKRVSSTAGNSQRVNIQFQVKNPTPRVNVDSAADVARKITKTFDDKKAIFDIVILLIKRLLALIYLRVVYKAAQYHSKYLTDIEYDNKYITKYFRRIDERRRCRGQSTLLPMKKIERHNYVDPYAVLPFNEERKRIFGQSFKLILEMITATTFILLDRLFYETLDIVSKHALVECNQSSEQDMIISVKGTGMIANLIRAIVNGFNCKRRVKVIHSNKRCLPKPIMLPNYYLYKIYGTYFLIWVFILLEGYTQRMNRCICAYFYPKREKKRVLFLYNETLKRRISLFRYMRGRIRRKAREIHLSFEANILLALRLRNRKKFDWMRYLPMGKRKCLICGEPEPSTPGLFHECATSGCDFLHCLECWTDVGEICYGCQPMESDQCSTALEDEDFPM